MNPISSVSTAAKTDLAKNGQLASASPSSKAGDKGGFAKLVDQFVQQTNETQVVSDQGIEDLVSGKTDNVQQVVMAVANAQMSFKLFMEIRNKLVDSYNELMRMQF